MFIKPFKFSLLALAVVCTGCGSDSEVVTNPEDQINPTIPTNPEDQINPTVPTTPEEPTKPDDNLNNVNTPIAGTSLTVAIDFNTQKFLGDVSQLDRSKYFNIHSVSNANQMTYEEWGYLINDLGVGFGRNFWSPFSYHSDHSYPTDEQAKIDGENSIEQTKKHANYAFHSNRNIITDHPKTVYKANMDTASAAEWAATYFKHYFDDETRPQFYEPINEPFVHADEFGIDDEIVREQITTLYKQIGQKFDEEGISTKVIGYASAWPSVELWDFKHFNERQKMFMDQAGEYMDALSIHFYDGINVTGANSQRSGSNMRAIMDLVETYSYHKWGKVKPHAVSEYGGIEKGYGDTYSDIKSVQSIRSINNMLFQFLDREDRLLTSIPFIGDKAAWYYSESNNWQPYGSVVLRPDVDSIENGKPTKFLWTPRIHFYQQWSEVQGMRVKSLANNPDIQTQAFVDGNKAYLALNSLSEKDEVLGLKFLNEMGTVAEVRIKSLKIWPNKAPIYSDSLTEEVNQKVTLIPGETVIIEYTFSEEVDLNNRYQIQDYYAQTHLQTIYANQAIDFIINDVSVADGQSYLKLSFARKHGKSKSPMVIVNDHSVHVPSNWAGGDQSSRDDFFGTIRIPVPNEWLKENNNISVTFPDADGRVSSVILQVHNDNSGEDVLLPLEPIAPDDSDKVLPEVDSISFVDTITQLQSATQYNISIQYDATISRDINVELWGPDGWITSSEKTVLAGSAKQVITLNLQTAPAVGEGYYLKTSIRPVASDWKSNLDAQSITDISII
ncbi:hypothetical protein GCM10007916_13900 [Psychromonas marina]|uniref:Beta-agarase n=1 Tax=Psychromonas marina TaxID=88364 RepID=A0ABQ6DZB0_9GAMM|nr:hypothetical protein [Psychromonas marina]GLS90323.1 hypothetical protein GCM10007916_13900 [Psychromonas marina]